MNFMYAPRLSGPRETNTSEVDAEWYRAKIEEFQAATTPWP